MSSHCEEGFDILSWPDSSYGRPWPDEQIVLFLSDVASGSWHKDLLQFLFGENLNFAVYNQGS